MAAWPSLPRNTLPPTLTVKTRPPDKEALPQMTANMKATRQRTVHDGTPRDTARTRERRGALRDAGPPPEPPLLTVDQLCAELHISRSTFYDWRAKGKAPECIVLPNGSLRVQREDLAEWLRKRRAA